MPEKLIFVNVENQSVWSSTVSASCVALSATNNVSAQNVEILQETKQNASKQSRKQNLEMQRHLIWNFKWAKMK